MTTPMNGKDYQRALAYALAAVPTDDDRAALQHVTYHGDRITGADGTRRHDGYLLEEIGAPVSVARISAQELMMALEYAHKMSKRRSGTFSVTHEGNDVSIEYGARSPLVHPLQVVDVGAHPAGAMDWVPEDAPLNPTGIGHVDCGSFKDAMSWWRSWDKDYGSCEIRGGQDGGPVRIDVTSGGRRVATAFMLPMDHPPAELRDVLPMEAVWEGRRACGKSNLDLDLSGDGAPADAPTILKIGEVELNVTGMGDPNELLVTGPCQHRDNTDACLPCTQDKIDAATAQRASGADEEEAPRKRSRKAKPSDPTPLAPDSVH